MESFLLRSLRHRGQTSYRINRIGRGGLDVRQTTA